MTAQPQLSEPASPPPRKTALRPGVFRYSAVGLLVALGLLFLAAPLIEDLPNGDLIEAALLSGVMLCSVLAIGARRRTLTLALLLLAPTLGGKWASHFWPIKEVALLYLVSAILFFGLVVAYLIRFVLRAPRVDANVLCAGLSGYLLLGLLWLPVYVMLARLNPAAFNMPAGGSSTMTGFNAFYFSFMTLCTVGYGDITPLSKGARMMAVIEAITGLFYVAVLISRLVAIYSSPPPAGGADPNPPAE